MMKWTSVLIVFEFSTLVFCQKNLSKIMVVGGTSNSDLESVEVIDLQSENSNCLQLQNFPISMRGGAGGLIDNQTPLVCAGFSDQCFTFQKENWSRSFSLNRERFHFAGLPMLNGPGKFLVSGGNAMNHQWLRDSEVLMADGWTTSNIPLLPFGIAGHCMLYSDEQTVMIIAGVEEINYPGQQTLILQNFTGPWVQGPPLVNVRYGHSCGRILDRQGGQQTSVIVAGGFDNERNIMTSVEVLDINRNTWRQGPELPSPIGGGSMVEDPWGGVVLLGGTVKQNFLNQEIFRLSDVGPNAKWEIMNQKLAIPRIYATAFLIQDELVTCFIENNI